MIHRAARQETPVSSLAARCIVLKITDCVTYSTGMFTYIPFPLDDSSIRNEPSVEPALPALGAAAIVGASFKLVGECAAPLSPMDHLNAALDTIPRWISLFWPLEVIGEPKWKVPLGRRDGPVSLATEAVSKLPGDGFTYKQLISNFAPVGLDENDMVALSGAHTIGLTHCGILTPRLYTSPDPTLNNTFVTAQKAACAQNPKRRY
ncbi:hypothetical protein R1sor_022722 [Riccia sorocarpa]|uniref:Plant heme peroxidase family profile domain-containing protein n=1 Tax=Riccia sorocarpa TaxID=122646 RepID=A0ABD3GPJ2_9MARC